MIHHSFEISGNIKSKSLTAAAVEAHSELLPVDIFNNHARKPDGCLQRCEPLIYLHSLILRGSMNSEAISLIAASKCDIDNVYMLISV